MSKQAEDYVVDVVEKRADPFLSLVILGLQGSGKTNIVRWLVSILRPHGWHISYVFPSILSKPSDVTDVLKKLVLLGEGEKQMIVVDDISFMYRTALQKTTADLLSLYARIRHLRPDVAKWFWVWIQHDVTASAPFIRASELLIVTKIDYTQWVRLVRNEKIPIKGDYLEELRKKPKGIMLFIDKIGKKVRRIWIVDLPKITIDLPTAEHEQASY